MRLKVLINIKIIFFLFHFGLHSFIQIIDLHWVLEIHK